MNSDLFYIWEQQWAIMRGMWLNYPDEHHTINDDTARISRRAYELIEIPDETIIAGAVLPATLVFTPKKPDGTPICVMTQRFRGLGQTEEEIAQDLARDFNTMLKIRREEAKSQNKELVFVLYWPLWKPINQQTWYSRFEIKAV